PIPLRYRSSIARLTFPDDRGLVAAFAADVTVDAVDARIERACDEPFRVRRLPLEDARPGLDPLELAREPGPEFFRVGGRPLIDAGVSDLRGPPPVVIRRKAAVFFEQRVDFRHKF